MLRRCLLVIVSCWSVYSVLQAQVDQENQQADRGYNTFNVALDLRQEFTPTLEALDSVELSIAAGVMSPRSLDSGFLTVAIRQGTVDGPIIGTSTAVSIPPRFSGTVLLTFAELVPLVPGDTYVIQPVPLSRVPPWPYGSPGWALDVSNPFAPGYPGGRLFLDGNLVEGNYDLIFREGIGIPEPPPLKLLVIGIGILSVVRARRNFVPGSHVSSGD